MSRLTLHCTVMAIVLLFTARAQADVISTKHNLSATGPGPTKSSTNSAVCGYCHGAHTVLKTVPLWNRTVADPSTYVIYSSNQMTSTARGASIAANSPSLACLSCHDGTIGLAAGVVNVYANMTMDSGGNVVADLLVGPANLGKNLSNDHPIGFSYVDAQAESPGTLNVLNPALTPLKLYSYPSRTNQIECGTCHAVHDNTYPPFLRMNNAGSTLCFSCHNK